MDVSPPPQGNDPIITQFKPVKGQWELTEDNIKRIDPKTGRTILLNYCEYINTTPLGVWRYLIEVKGCDINAQNTYKDTPIHHAIGYFDPNDGGDITVLMYLLGRENINGNLKDGYGYTLLHEACQKINKLPLEIFQHLIETHGADVNAQAKNKNTPLHNALSFFNPKNGDDITVLYYLLSQKGVNANIKGEYGHNLLHTACNNINALPFDVFKLLIETHGADVNAQNDIKDTPLHCAVRRFNPDVGGNITTLTYLLTQKGINGNIKGQYSCTLLHEACENIKRLPLDVFKLLIETISCNVNAQDNNNDTPLHRALCYFKPHNDDISVLQYLSNQTNTKGKRDDTLLHYACEKINKLSLDVFKLLIEKHGCDVNAQNNNNDTPIHLAFRCFDPNDGGDITVLTYLINQPKVHVNIKGKDGNTILHYACEKIHDLPLEIFKLLIGTHGADVNIQDNKKDTPSHNAFSSFDPNYDDHLVPVLLYLLSQKNIDVNIKDKNGHTLLHLACICEIGYDDEDDEDDDDDDDHDDEDDDDSDEDIQNQKADTNLCQIVEVIAERCLEQIFDEITI